MRRLIVITASLLAAVAVAIVPAASSGSVSPAQLENAGWDCPFVLGATHCAPPGGLGRVLNGTAKTMSFLVFSPSTGRFLGIEHIVRTDVFNGQPCPTDPPSRQYTYLKPLIGLDYYACHRYDSSF